MSGHLSLFQCKRKHKGPCRIHMFSNKEHQSHAGHNKNSVPDTFHPFEKNGIFGASEIQLILFDSYHWTGTGITAGIFGSNLVFMNSSVHKTQSGEEILLHDNAEVLRVSAVCIKFSTMGRIGSIIEIFDFLGRILCGAWVSVYCPMPSSLYGSSFFFG